MAVNAGGQVATNTDRNGTPPTYDVLAADEFVEWWNGPRPTPVPAAGRGPFAFAGRWGVGKPPGRAAALGFCFLTAGPNDQFRPLRDRVPVPVQRASRPKPVPSALVDTGAGDVRGCKPGK